MNPRNLFTAISTMLAGVLIIVCLYSYSAFRLSHKSSFTRLFPAHLLTDFRFTDLQYNSYYFAGSDSQTVYLGNYTAPDKVLAISTDFLNRHFISLNISDSIKMNWERARVITRGNEFYLGEGSSPAMLHTVSATNAMIRVQMDSLHFDRDWLPLSLTSFVVRTYSTPMKQNILVKKTTGTDTVIQSNGILEKQIDGKFCTDGGLLFDREQYRLIYIYNYRNQFIVMDTNLHIISKYRTIDTTTHAKITLDTIKAESRVTFSSPPLMVNKRACIAANKLFVNSALTADNETPLGKLGTDIDVYNLKDGTYLFSFSVPSFRNEKLLSMAVATDRLYCIFGKWLASYRLHIK